MKTLAELLRAADPLRYETQRSPEERRRMRERVLNSPRRVEKPPRRRLVPVAVVALMLMGVASVGYWSWFAADVIAAVRFEVRLAEETPAHGLQEVAIAGPARTIYLHEEPVVTNGDIARAELMQADSASTYSIVVTFNADGAAKMARATERHVGGPVAILIDGKVVAVPVLKSPISSSAVISGIFPRAEADRIVGGIIGR